MWLAIYEPSTLCRAMEIAQFEYIANNDQVPFFLPYDKVCHAFCTCANTFTRLSKFFQIADRSTFVSNFISNFVLRNYFLYVICCRSHKCVTHMFLKAFQTFSVFRILLINSYILKLHKLSFCNLIIFHAFH